MLLYIFFLLGTWKGVLGKDVICDGPPYRVCSSPTDWRFPKNEADLNRMCPQFLQNIDCLKDYSNKCEDDSKKKRRQDLRDVAEDVCQNDSQLHLCIVQNIGCFNEMVQNDFKACHKYFDEKTEVMLKHIQITEAEKGTYDKELWMSFQCLIYTIDRKAEVTELDCTSHNGTFFLIEGNQRIFRMQSLVTLCLASKSCARCGSDAGDIYLELVKRAGFTEHCHAASEESLVELLAILELDMEEEASLSRIIGRE